MSTGRQTIAAVETLVRPPSQSTHRPTREAGQLLPVSVTLPALATLPLSMSPTALTATGGIVQVRIVQLN